MGVVGVLQQINVEAKRHVADCRDLVLRRTAGVQEPRRGKLQLLQSVETQTLHERSFNLTEGGRREGEEEIMVREKKGKKE